MRAHQIMTRSVISVAPHTSIVEAANIMLKRHVSGLTVVDDAGKLVTIGVKVGDKVLFGKYSGQEFKLEGQDLLHMREDDVIGVVA